MPVAVRTPARVQLTARGLPVLPLAGRSNQVESHTPAKLLAADGRGEFLAMVLHELQNPLGSILAGVACARDAEGFLRQSEWLWTGASTRLGKWKAYSLTSWALPGFPPHVPTPEKADGTHVGGMPPPLVAGPTSSAGGAASRLEVGAEAVWVNADPDRLELVLSNLLDNACNKYTEPGGLGHGVYRDHECRVELRVRDTGVGIAPEVLPFVFDPFVRDTTPMTLPRRGSGIGLLLVRTLVESHGGRASRRRAAVEGRQRICGPSSRNGLAVNHISVITTM